MPKVIAVAFSDLHLNLYAKFNKDYKRTKDSFLVLFKIKEVCNKYNVPALFCGDLFHKPEVIQKELFTMVVKQFLKLNGTSFKCCAISGNHEIMEISKVGIQPKSWIYDLDPLFIWLHDLDYKTFRLTNNIQVHGVPYVDHNIGLSTYLKNMKLEEGYKHILLLHTDYPGAKDTDGRVVDSAENINLNMLNRFDLVLCGHIHKPQRLSKKVYMLGAPIQQRRTDKDCKMGYWLVMDDLSMEFKELKGFPKFIDVESEDEVKDDGNYYTVIPKKSSEKVNTNHKITKTLSKKKLAKRYLKEKGIKDRGKEDLLIKILKKSEV